MRLCGNITPTSVATSLCVPSEPPLGTIASSLPLQCEKYIPNRLQNVHSICSQGSSSSRLIRPIYECHLFIIPIDPARLYIPLDHHPHRSMNSTSHLTVNLEIRALPYSEQSHIRTRLTFISTTRTFHVRMTASHPTC